MIKPACLGWWIAFESTLHPSNVKADDLKVLVESCKATGASWIALRAGAGGANDPSLSEETIRVCLENGITPYVWIFAYRNTQAKEIAGYRRWFLAGARGAIINAEYEYESATAADARALVAGIRAAWDDAQGERRMRGLDPVSDSAFVGHAPPDYLGSGVNNALRDELVQLDEICDAIMPQVYAWEHDDRGHAYHLDRVLEGYAKRGLTSAVVWPVGCSYRPRTRGYDGNTPRPTPPLANEAELVASDVEAFLDHPGVSSCPAPSLYALDACKRINGTADQVIARLEARTEAARMRVTLPSPAPLEVPNASDFVSTLAKD